MSPPARQSWALLSSRVPTHAVASSQQMEGSVKFHQPEPMLERETETQMVWGWRGPRVWGWTGWREGACPTLRGAGGITGLAFRAPVSPMLALGCSLCSFTENKVCLLTPLLVRCHHSQGRRQEVTGAWEHLEWPLLPLLLPAFYSPQPLGAAPKPGLRFWDRASLQIARDSLVAQKAKSLPTMQGT